MPKMLNLNQELIYLRIMKTKKRLQVYTICLLLMGLLHGYMIYALIPYFFPDKSSFSDLESFDFIYYILGTSGGIGIVISLYLIYRLFLWERLLKLILSLLFFAMPSLILSVFYFYSFLILSARI